MAAAYTGTGARYTVREYAMGKKEEKERKRIEEEYIIIIMSSRVAPASSPKPTPAWTAMTHGPGRPGRL